MKMNVLNMDLQNIKQPRSQRDPCIHLNNWILSREEHAFIDALSGEQNAVVATHNRRSGRDSFAYKWCSSGNKYESSIITLSL